MQSSTESTLPKRISREDAHSSRDVLLSNNSANPDIVLNETANQRQEDMTDEENNIENGKVVDSEKHCSFIFFIYIYTYIINICTFENKIHNHQVGIFLFTWNLNQQEPDQRGY